MGTFRELCAELIDLNDDGIYEAIDWSRLWDEFIARVRTALDKPEPEGLTDEELDDIIIELALPGLDRKSILLESGYERRLMRAAIAADRSRHRRPAELTKVTEASVEVAAKQIYEAMRFLRTDSTPIWVVGGNSDVQEAARKTARSVLSLLAKETSPLNPGKVTGLRPWVQKMGAEEAISWLQGFAKDAIAGQQDLKAEILTHVVELVEQLSDTNAGLTAAADSAYLDNLSLLYGRND